MNETQLIILLLGVNILITLILILRKRGQDSPQVEKFQELERSLQKVETSFREDFRINREENSAIAKSNRGELNETLKDFKKELSETLKEITTQVKIDSQQQRDNLDRSFKAFQESFEKSIISFNELQREKFTLLGEEQKKMVETTEKRLEEIRITVDEKLQKTLNERLGQSFEVVVRQLENVQKGLGEMQTLAQDVGSLKNVLSNVKLRGSIGEVQLAMLLEQILAPSQYEANVKTKKGSSDLVEFAIKLPGKDDQNTAVWLPIDAKFPKDIYEQLQAAHDTGDLAKIEAAQKVLETTIKKMAKDIHDKYIDPPNTTDFGIMFLPFEGIYAEVVRSASLLDELQRNYKIVVTGPTTLAAILNSLQMGFKTLAIQQRSGEVWKILGDVKKEFKLFSGLVEKAQGNIQTGLNQLDDVLGKRTRAIQRKLKDVELPESVAKEIYLSDSIDEGSLE
jgi:DNA recombination protein RmuC